MPLPRVSTAAALVLCFLAFAPTAEGAGRRQERREYLEILRLWTAGARERAASRLAEKLTLAPGARRAGIARAVRPLARQAVRGAGPDALLPVALLHEEAYTLLARQRRASQALEVALEVLALYADEATTADDRAVVSALETSLAGRMAEAHVEVGSRELTRTAVRRDPSNRAALFALAVADERFADPAAAVRSLRTLLRLEPDHREARLRLAVNLFRVGEPDAGLATLRRLVTDDGRGDWIAVVARQELARRLVATDDLGSAREILDEVAEHPSPDPALAVQRAFVAELSGSGSDGGDGGGGDLFAALARSAAVAEIPARSRYLRSPNPLLDALRRDLRRRERASAARLARFLGEVEPVPSAP